MVIYSIGLVAVWSAGICWLSDGGCSSSLFSEGLLLLSNSSTAIRQNLQWLIGIIWMLSKLFYLLSPCKSVWTVSSATLAANSATARSICSEGVSCRVLLMLSANISANFGFSIIFFCMYFSLMAWKMNSHVIECFMYVVKIFQQFVITSIFSTDSLPFHTISSFDVTFLAFRLLVCLVTGSSNDRSLKLICLGVDDLTFTDSRFSSSMHGWRLYTTSTESHCIILSCRLAEAKVEIWGCGWQCESVGSVINRNDSWSFWLLSCIWWFSHSSDGVSSLLSELKVLLHRFIDLPATGNVFNFGFKTFTFPLGLVRLPVSELEARFDNSSLYNKSSFFGYVFSGGEGPTCRQMSLALSLSLVSSNCEWIKIVHTVGNEFKLELERKSYTFGSVRRFTFEDGRFV